MAVHSNLRVVIDARPISQRHAGGFKTYVRALVTGLRERADAGLSTENVILYIDRSLPADVKTVLPSNVETRMLSSGRLKTDFLLFARQLKRDAPDVVMGTSNYLPLALPRPIPKVVTIHDAMGVKSYPWDIGIPRTFRERVVNRYWAFVTRQSAHRARLVLTVSNGSRKELTTALGVQPERFRVVYNGWTSVHHRNRSVTVTVSLLLSRQILVRMSIASTAPCRKFVPVYSGKSICASFAMGPRPSEDSDRPRSRTDLAPTI